MKTDGDTSGSTPLFAVFLLSMLSIVLVPYTLYKLFGEEEDEKEVVKTWESKKDKKPSLQDKAIARLKKTFTTKMIIAWAIFFALLWFVQAASQPFERFDPFEILNISESATEADIKRAYRKLSLQYHPDKNPDPAAADYFAEYITKAYKALTDEVSRENYKKYGHPDGQQAVSISVALPEWFFSKEKESAPTILLSLLLGGIVLPLSLAACYLGRTRNSTGPNEVMMETTQWYALSPYNIKQFQSVAKISETFVCAMEFVNLPITADQGPALDHLRKELVPYFSELKDLNGPFFKKRNHAIIKAHILLYAHLAREPVPQPLLKDQLFVLQKAPRLVQEMFSIATVPRVRPNYGWLAPAVGCVELMQCIIQAVSPEEKKKSPAPLKSAEGSPALLQLPNMDASVIHKLAKRKIKNIHDLHALPKSQRRNELQSAGITGNKELDQIETALSAFPYLHATASLTLEDDPVEQIQDIFGESDLLTCTIHAVLTRASHDADGFDVDSLPGSKSSGGPRVYAPSFPFPREEHWICMVVDHSSNVVMGWVRVPLMEAETAGARLMVESREQRRRGGSGGGGEQQSMMMPPLSFSTLLGKSTSSSSVAAAVDSTTNKGTKGSNNNTQQQDGLSEHQSEERQQLIDLGQKIEIRFLAPPAGKYDLQVYIMPDSWIGADRVIGPLKLKTMEPSRAQREGRAGRRSNATAGKKVLERSEESEQLMAEHDDDAGEEVMQGGGEYDSDDDDDEYDDDDDDGDGWDSDEYGGSMETDSDRDDDIGDIDDGDKDKEA